MSLERGEIRHVCRRYSSAKAKRNRSDLAVGEAA
jgi:hypothetical protein